MNCSSGFFHRKSTTDMTGQASSSVQESTPSQHIQEQPTLADIRNELISLVQNGRLVIPDGLMMIPDSLFDCSVIGKWSVKQLHAIVVPGTVKSIGARAFGACSNLEEIVLSEGIERIETNAFTGCVKLRRLQLPASVKEIDGRAFINSGINEPVFSADGKVLVYYPPEWEKEEYTVPEGVKTIVWGAFWEPKNLKRIILPQSLKRICTLAFISCGFTEVVIPPDTEIEREAFSCKHGIRLIREKKQNALEESMEYYKANGMSFLSRQSMELPKTRYWHTIDFRLLAKQCEAGDVEAMERMSDYFFDRAKKAKSEEDSVFYQCAAHFWQTRAYLYGSKKAQMYLLAWCEKNPDARMTSPGIDERLFGSADGKLLNALGFPFFKSGRGYILEGVDKDGVVEVSSWESTEGPDEDGFGMEECYDWWYLDEYLTLPAKVGYFHSYSNHDKECNAKKFLALHDQVAAARKH